MANATRKPKKTEAETTQAGLKAHNLAVTHKAVLEPRLAPGVVDGLAADLTQIGIVVPGAVQTRTVARTAKVSQDVALAQGYALVSAIRAAVVRAKAAADVRKAYGVGAKVNALVVKDVKASIATIVARAEANPSEARSLGILQKDIDALKADNDAITAADEDQEKKRATAPQSTKARNQTLVRIIEATDRIAGAGILEFAKDEAIRAEFQALIGAGLPNKKPKKKES